MPRDSSRLLLVVSGILSVLLVALAIIQYRWAGRVAEAALERTRNQLQSAAKLFARDFNLELVRTYAFFQSKSDSVGSPPAPIGQATELPRIAKDVYLLQLTEGGQHRLYHLQHDGAWTPVEPASAEFEDITGKMTVRGFDGTTICDTRLFGEVPALVIPLATHVPVIAKSTPTLKGCIYAGLDEKYLHDQLFPAIAQRAFGKDAAGSYSFPICSRTNPSRTLYGSSSGAGAEARSAVRQPLFELRMEDLAAGRLGGSGGARIFVRSSVTRAAKTGARQEAGLWQLEVMPRAGPLASLYTRWREGNLLLSMAVELMLLAAVGFIVTAARRMQRLADQKMQFVAGITHELRNPLSAIRVLAGNQADGLVNSPEQVRQYGQFIQQQSGRLNDLVEQALQYAGVHSKARLVRRAEVDLRRVVDDALTGAKPELDRGGFEVETSIASDLPLVLGDAQALKQAIENLLSNAMKYANGHCWVRLGAQADRDQKSVSVTVEDHGIGIDPAEGGQIFDPFFRGSRAGAAQIPGTGLGLSLVRSTAELHGGTVTFQSAPGKGSSFTLRLPAADRPAVDRQ